MQSELVIKFRDRILKVSLLLSEDELAPLFDGAAWAGTQLWDAAIHSVDYISEHYSLLMQAPGCRLIELGCGTGVPGMCCRVMGSNVLLTEQGQLVSLLQQNLRGHRHIHG